MFQAHLQFTQAKAQTKNCKKASVFPIRKKNYFLKFLPFKIFKTTNKPNTQETGQINDNKNTVIQQFNNDRGQPIWQLSTT